MEYKLLSEVSVYRKDRIGSDKVNKGNYISTENMLSNRGGVENATTVASAKTFPAYKKGDILLSNIRPYFKKIWYATQEGGCSNDVLVVKAGKTVDSKFLYYVLSDNNFFNYSTVTSKGTKMPRGSKNAIMKYWVPNLDLPTQKKIADILSSYDKLIKANNERIELLEQTAQELYKEWFVRFRFPGYENAKFEDGIPEGWERNKIQKYYNTCSGGTPSRSKPEYFENGVYPWVKTGEIKDCVIIDTEESITQEAVNSSSAKVLSAKSVAMAMYGVNIGLLAYFDSEMTCNQACCVFSDKRGFSSKHYLYYYLKSIREYLLLISFGAAQQNLSQDLIKKIKITMPSDDIIQDFEKRIDDIYESIRILLMQNKNLAKQRDMLLPRLMSGKLEV
jgi:type I restriction enzyme S subunit